MEFNNNNSIKQNKIKIVPALEIPNDGYNCSSESVIEEVSPNVSNRKTNSKSSQRGQNSKSSKRQRNIILDPVQIKQNLLEKIEQPSFETIQKLAEQIQNEKVCIDYQKTQHMNILIHGVCKKNKINEEKIIIINALEQIELFKQYKNLFINPKVQDIACNNVDIVFLKKRQVLFHYGKYGDEFYTVLKGSIGILLPSIKGEGMSPKAKMNQSNFMSSSMNEDKLERLPDDQYYKLKYPDFKLATSFKQGKSFGEIALMTQDRRTATSVAIQDSIVLSLSKKGFNNIMEGCRLYEKNDKIEFMSQFPFFKIISKGALMSLLIDVKIGYMKYNQVIYNFKDPIENVYFIKKGEVEIQTLLQTEEDENEDQCDDIKKQKFVKYNKAKQRVDYKKKFQVFSLGIRGENKYFGIEEIVNKQYKRKYKVIAKSSEVELYYVNYKIFLDNIREYNINQLFKQEGLMIESYNDNKSEQLKTIKKNLYVNNNQEEQSGIFVQNNNQNNGIVKQENSRFLEKQNFGNSPKNQTNILEQSVLNINNISKISHNNYNNNNSNVSFLLNKSDNNNNDNILFQEQKTRNKGDKNAVNVSKSSVTLPKLNDNLVFFPQAIPCNVDYKIKSNYFKQKLEHHKNKIKNKQIEEKGIFNQFKYSQMQNFKNSESYRMDLIKKELIKKLNNRSELNKKKTIINMEKQFFKLNSNDNKKINPQIFNSKKIIQQLNQSQELKLSYGIQNNQNQNNNNNNDYIQNQSSILNDTQNGNQQQQFQLNLNLSKNPMERSQNFLNSYRLLENKGNLQTDLPTDEVIQHTFCYRSQLSSLPTMPNSPYGNNSVRKKQNSDQFFSQFQQQQQQQDKVSKIGQLTKNIKKLSQIPLFGNDFMSGNNKVKYQKGTICKIPAQIHYFKQNCKAPTLKHRLKNDEISYYMDSPDIEISQEQNYSQQIVLKKRKNLNDENSEEEEDDDESQFEKTQQLFTEENNPLEYSSYSINQKKINFENVVKQNSQLQSIYSPDYRQQRSFFLLQHQNQYPVNNFQDINRSQYQDNSTIEN